MVAAIPAIISAFLMASISHIDKYILTKHLKKGDIGSLVIFSSLISIPFMLVIRIIEPNVMDISLINAIVIIFNGMLYALWIIPYFYALESAEASIVAPLFQLSPIITYVLGSIFLGENLTLVQIIGCALILVGSFSLTIENDEEDLKKYKIRKDTFLLMSLAAFLSAFSSFMFKSIAIEETFWVTSFWQYLGFALFSLIVIVFVKSYRNQFINVIKSNKRKILALNIVNEILNLTAKTLYDYALLLAPIALVSFLAEGSEPIFVFVLGIIMTIFFPHLCKEKIDKISLIRRVLAIGIVSCGAFVISIV